MKLLDLKDRRDIVAVIEYLVEIHQKDNTVGDVMERFHLTPDEYRMCCDLAMPALRQGNMKGRFTAVSRVNRAMRKAIKALYEDVQENPEKAVQGVKVLWESYCGHACAVVYGTASARETAQCAVSSELGPVRPEEGTGNREQETGMVGD